MAHPYLTREFYENAHREHGCFPRSLEALCTEAERLAADPAAASGFVDLVEILRNMKKWQMRIAISDNVSMTNALAVAALVPDIIDGLMRDGFSREISEKTVLDVDESIMAPTLKGEAPGLDVALVQWFLHFINLDIVRIGRLNFERVHEWHGRANVYENAAGEEVIFPYHIGMNAEGGACQHGEDMAFFATITEEDGMICGHRAVNGIAERAITRLPKSEWKLVLQFGDPTIGVHIPDKEPFDVATLEATYQEALPILKKCWPELHPKALTCQSWLMDHQMDTFLRPESNIVQFHKPFTQIPARANNTSALNYVFGEVPKSFENLPEDNSMRRGMKALYMRGGSIRFAFAYWLLRDGERKQK